MTAVRRLQTTPLSIVAMAAIAKNDGGPELGREAGTPA